MFFSPSKLLINHLSWYNVHFTETCLLLSFLQVMCLSTTCWFPFYNMLIICLQHVDYLSTACWLTVYNMLITCLQHVDFLSTTCWLPVYNMLIICLQHVDYLSTTCWLPFCNMFNISVCIRNSSLTVLYHLGKQYLFCSNISRIPVMIQIYRVTLVKLLIATFIFWYFFYTFSHYNAHIIWTFVNIRPNVDLSN